MLTKLQNLVPGYKTYLAAAVGIATALIDMYNHGANGTNLMALVSAFGCVGGRALVK